MPHCTQGTRCRFRFLYERRLNIGGITCDSPLDSISFESALLPQADFPPDASHCCSHAVTKCLPGPTLKLHRHVKLRQAIRHLKKKLIVTQSQTKKRKIFFFVIEPRRKIFFCHLDLSTLSKVLCRTPRPKASKKSF